MTRFAAFPLVFLLSTPALVLAGDAYWPGWRGPDRDDVSKETGLLKSWSKREPRPVWRFENCGIGYSGPAIVGKQLYILGGRRNREELIALDLERGTELWSATIGPVFDNNRGSGPRSTPTVDGSRVYALGGGGELICATTDTGTVVWKRSLTDLGGEPAHWGYCESVLVDGDRVICTPGGEKGTVAALDKKSGKLIWQSKDFTEPAQYASPLVVEHAGVRQYIQLTQKAVVGLRADTGEVLWKSEWPGEVAVIPTPIYHAGQVFVSSGYGVGCKLFRIDDKHQPTDVYFNKNMKNHHGGVILVDGHLYGYSDKRGWVCQNFETGDIVWREKEKFPKGSLTYADGRFYCYSEKDGSVVLIEASTGGWREHGRLEIKQRSKLRKKRWRIWTHPVVAGGRLYLRNQELLFSFDVKPRPSS